jgi:hypothetical protein
MELIFSFLSERETNLEVRPFFPGHALKLEDIAFLLKFNGKLADACIVKTMLDFCLSLAQEACRELTDP